MFKKYFSLILQTVFLIMAIAAFHSISDDGPYPAEDVNGGYTCPAVWGCKASGCSGRFVKKCTYTPEQAESCPDETQCQYRF